MTQTDGVKRTGPPQAVQKLRENVYLVQVPINEVPSADWKRLFYDTQQAPAADFPPRSVEMLGLALRFRSEAALVEQRTVLIDKWIERANQKQAASGVGSEERQKRRVELTREQAEIAEWNGKWAKL
ncbi:MAG TPA: hypothetical protein VHE23_03985 [Candidatus Acidoferrales bacterium]|nr:hypothetical protein [Candidatus Acidoferrales bacterium]